MEAERERRNILVVDDEPEIVDTLKDFLSRKGYGVIGAFNGDEALSILEKERQDLIFLDIKMPGIQGAEVARIIKEKYPSIKIIILTGYSDEGQRLLEERLLEGLLLKPVRLQELYNKLLEVLRQNGHLTLELKSSEGIKARVLLIKARLLFIEPSLEIYNYLNAHFKRLSNKGENYEIEEVDNEMKILEKSLLFNPDLLLINAASFRKFCSNVFSEVNQKQLCPKEIIIYNAENIASFQKSELERLTKTIEATCLKNGFVEVKWVEI